MKNIFYPFLIILFMIGCEDTKTDESILGTWNGTSFKSYDNAECTGDFESQLDTMIAQFGNGNFLVSYTFDETQATIKTDYFFTNENLCFEAGGDTLVGDSCVSTYYSMSLSLEDLCGEFEGVYSTNGCAISDENTSDYTFDGTELLITEYAGTDSADTDSMLVSLTSTTMTLTDSGTDEGDDEEVVPYCEVWELTKQ